MRFDSVGATGYSNTMNILTLLSVPDHGKDDLKPGTLNHILKTAGLK